MSKYNNKKTRVHGIDFDSAEEAKRYQYLYFLGKSGQISDLRLQVPFELIPSQYEEKPTGEVYKIGDRKGQPKMKRVCVERAVNYIADFVYTENGKTIVEDTKGMRTPEYIIKRKLMLYIHNIAIKEV